MLKRSFVALFISILFACQLVYADAGESYDRSYRLTLWAVILFALIAEYLTVNKLFNKPNSAWLIATLTLFTAGSVYLAMLALLNIMLIMSGASSLLLINILSGCVIVTGVKMMMYSLVFHFPLNWRGSVWIAVLSSMTVILWFSGALLH